MLVLVNYQHSQIVILENGLHGFGLVIQDPTIHNYSARPAIYPQRFILVALCCLLRL